MKEIMMSDRLDVIRTELMAGVQRSVNTSARRRRRGRVAACAAAVIAVSTSTAYATGLISLTPSDQSTLNEQTAMFDRLIKCGSAGMAPDSAAGKALTDPHMVQILHIDDALTGAPITIGINKEKGVFTFVDGPHADAVARRIENFGKDEQVMAALAKVHVKPTTTYGVTRWAKTSVDVC